MEHFLGPIPTDNEVRRLLSGARFTPDPRALAAVTILLSLGVDLGVVRQLRWHCLDIKSRTLRTSRVGTAPVSITNLLIRQLFGKYKTKSPSIDLLLKRTLISSGLSIYRCNDFVRWSRKQTPAIRLSVATP
jgi:integrase